jgi:hypothetical protein
MAFSLILLIQKISQLTSKTLGVDIGEKHPWKMAMFATLAVLSNENTCNYARYAKAS